MKKMISILLLLTTLLLTLSACGAGSVKIEDYEWQMRTVMHTEGESFTVPAIGEADESYPDAKVIDLTLTAKDGTITITDATNGNTYTGTYKLIDTTLESNNYEVTIDVKTGYATVALTEYNDGSKEATLPINLGEYSLYFYEDK